MTAPFVPRDQEVRQRIEEALGETIIVEAGAGTGKTRSLVDRVVALIAAGRTTVDRIAAITFTEAAAAELRDRIREALETASTDKGRSEVERQRCQNGVKDLDNAAMQTLHSFAASLLRERPLEAGLPPAFETLDEIRADLLFQEHWGRWLDGALEDPEVVPALRQALALGLSLEHLRASALAFHRNYDLLETASFPDAPEPRARAASALVESVPELERLCCLAHNGEEDPLVGHVRGVLGLARRLKGVDPTSLSARRLLFQSPAISTSRGRQADWDDDPESGVNGCKRVKEVLAGLHHVAQEELGEARRAALTPLLRAVRRSVLDYAQERKRQGLAEFHDLLVWARDLLRDRLDVRDHFRRRFTHLLIDEFQDTDPLQAEIAVFLAEEVADGTPPEARPRRWTEVTPTPGKLFVVGDPKQSIYRFRRADVALTARLSRAVGQTPLPLVQNFRAQRPLIAWVNHLFERWMQGGPGQAAYIPLAHRWQARTDHPVPPAVRHLGGAVEATRVGEVRELEAKAIAQLLQRIQAEEWPVLDKGASEEAQEERFRPALYGDICILFPQRSGLRALELALEDAGIPYRVESAALVLESQEVRDLLNCLRAIDDPADQVALVAALRSPALACSDVDLLEFVEKGSRLDYLSPNSGLEGPVAEGLQRLAEYHRKRLWTSPAALMEEFIRDTRLMEVALGHARPRERWRRYHFLLERARAFAEAGGTSLRAFLEWMERQREEGARMVESPVPETDEDAVRIMTIHAAKGLEFPIVLMTGLNSSPSPRSEAVIFDREVGGAEVRLGPSGTPFQTGGYDALAERERTMEEAERVRLMYVAATRARDHLLISLYRTSRDTSSDAAQIATYLADSDHLWQPVPEGGAHPPPEGRAVKPIPAISDDTPEGRQEWVSERQRLISKRERPPAVAATTLAQEAKEEQDAPEEPWRRGRGGTSLGRAVHAVLQTVDLTTGEGLEEIARAQATAEGIPHREADVVRLARRALQSDVVRRAVASKRWWREVWVAAPVGDGTLEGFIDLLFEEEGALVVVDYKTDALRTQEEVQRAMQRYRLQGGAYSLALARAVGREVKEVVFLFLQPYLEEALKELEKVSLEAEAAAVAHLGGVE